MKLSAMIETVTASKEIEANLGARQSDAEVCATDAEAQAKARCADAETCLKQADETFDALGAAATDKAEWNKSETAFENQLAWVRPRTQEWHDFVSVYEARAEAAKAHAAALSKYAVAV